MTIKEAVAADTGRSGIKVVSEFSKGFRINELTNLEPGEEFTVPTGDDFIILQQPVMRGTEPVLDRNGDPVCSEFIKVQTNKNRIVNFFPSSITKIAFRVDPETGKDVTENRIVRTEGDIVAYATKHPDMNDSMKRLQGCTIKYDLKERVNIRQFGVSNDKATKKDVTQTNIGKWNLVGKVKPDNWEV